MWIFSCEKHKSLGSRVEQTLLAFSRNEDLWLWFPNFGRDIFLPFLSFYSFSHSPNPKSHSVWTLNLWWLMCTSHGGVHCALCRSRPTMFYNIPGWHTSTRLCTRMHSFGNHKKSIKVLILCDSSLIYLIYLIESYWNASYYVFGPDGTLLERCSPGFKTRRYPSGKMSVTS